MSEAHPHDNETELRPPASDRPRVWIVNLPEYRTGRLRGEWVDAADPAELRETIQRIGTADHNVDQSWAIFDYENFGIYRIDEHEDLATLSEVARGIEHHGFAYGAFAAMSDAALEDLETDFSDAFMGFFESRTDFVNTIIGDFEVDQAIAGMPSWLAARVSIDRNGIARDLEGAGDVIFQNAPGGGIYAFRG